MSILAWFRGLFGRPTKKRQIVVSARRYVKMTDLPQRGALKEQDARRMVAMFPDLTYKQTARKLNAMGYLTPRKQKWTVQTVRYWRQTDEKLSKRRQYFREYDKFRRRPQTVIFRNADLRPRHNGIN